MISKLPWSENSLFIKLSPTWDILQKTILGNTIFVVLFFKKIFASWPWYLISCFFKYWSLVLSLCLGNVFRICVLLMLTVFSWNASCDMWTANKVNYANILIPKGSCTLERDCQLCQWSYLSIFWGFLSVSRERLVCVLLSPSRQFGLSSDHWV